MKTAHEIFLTLGVPLTDRSRFPGSYAGFRGFNEHDIQAIQDEAFKAGISKAVRDLTPEAAAVVAEHKEKP